MDLLLAIGDLWTRRRARPCAVALWRVRQLSPATVITGAAEGLGLALASIIAGEGRTVVLLARAQDALEAAKERLRRKYPSARVIAVQVDAGQPDAPDLIDAVLAKSGLYLDVLVNNAGIGIGGEFCTLAPEKLEELVQTNVTAVTRLTRHYLPAMRARARGGIMNIASIAAFTPGPWQSVYFASKAYILSLTAAIGSECSGEGVRICVLAPGPIETRIHEKMGTSTTFYRALLPSASPDRMARLAWRSYRMGRRVVVPGLLNSCLAWSARALPYELIVPFVGWLMKPRASEGRLRKNAIGTRPGGRGTES
jgi:short-subunit dehydrogenase